MARQCGEWIVLEYYSKRGRVLKDRWDREPIKYRCQYNVGHEGAHRIEDGAIWNDGVNKIVYWEVDDD